MEQALLEKLRRLDREASLLSSVPTEVQDELDAIISPELDQVVHVAKSSGQGQTAARNVLLLKWIPFFKALAADVFHSHDEKTYETGPSRKRLRSFSSHYRKTNLLEHDLNKDDVFGEAAVLFTKLLDEYKAEKGLPFPAYIEYLLPLRVESWLDGQMFHQEGGKRVLKRFEPLDESMRQIDWQPAGADNGVRISPEEMLFETEPIRRLLLATMLHEGVLQGEPHRLPTFRELCLDVRRQGLKLKPAVVPVTAKLLLSHNAIREPSPYYRTMGRRRIPMYVPRNEHLERFMRSDQVLGLCRAESRKPQAAHSWATLVAYYSSAIVTEAELAEQFHVTQQRVSYLLRAGTRRVLRHQLLSYFEAL
ncbi:MAG: hypothetical protein ACYC5Y_00020 [Symbiobacteriia bacterium]